MERVHSLISVHVQRESNTPSYPMDVNRKRSIRNQILSSICGNLLTVSAGTVCSWASANFLELQKADTLLPSGPLSLREATVTMSIFYIGAVIGNMVIPHAIVRCGSKRTMLGLGIAEIINWLLTIYAQNPFYLYLSSILSGAVEAGQFTCVTIFVSEISHDNMRGSLNSVTNLSYNIGMLIGFVLAQYYDFIVQAKFHLMVPIVFLILFVAIPESPRHLMNMQRHEAAKKSQKFFKATELVELSPSEEKETEDSEKLTLSDFTNHRARKAILIAFIGVCLNSLQGFTVMITYVTEIFAGTNSDISAIHASTVTTAVLIVANLIYMNSVDRAKRRTFYIYSSLATTLGLTIFAAYLYFLTDDPAYNWVPIVCLSYSLFASCLGMSPIPLLVATEIFPIKIKEYGYASCVLLALVITSIMTELYPHLKEHIGLFGWIVFFAVASFCNAIFGVFGLPETRGKSYDQIMRILDK